MSHNKRQDRPWEALRSAAADSASSLADRLARANAVLEAPSVTVDGIRYWSDRFYLNHVDSDPLPTSSCSSHGGCTCGAKQPPPLLSRERLVQSLDVKAAVLGTFTLDTSWLVESFPQLVGPNATIPTLILHGSKTYNQQERQRRMAEEGNGDDSDNDDDDETSSFFESSQEEQENSQPSVTSHQCKEKTPTPMMMKTRSTKQSSIPLVEFSSSSRLSSTTIATTLEENCEEQSSSSQGAYSLQTQAQTTATITTTRVEVTAGGSLVAGTPKNATRKNGDSILLSDATGRPSTVTPEAVSSSKNNNTTVDLGKLCSTTYVMSTWNKPNEAPNAAVSYEPVPTNSSKDGSKQGTTNSEFKFGVHHPKFMILFEKSGDVVVVVSTANLTKTRTIEGTWVQRFHPNRRYQQQQQRIRWQQQQQQPTGSNSRSRPPTPPPPSPVKRNDFGLVLQDFLEKLDSSAPVLGHTKIHEFVYQHLEFPLTELAQSFYFEKAQVHLVPVVPGDWEDAVVPTSTTKKNPKTKATAKSSKIPFSYGRQRVRDILQWETLLESSRDRLIIQPTSFGGNWKRGDMADVVRSYLNISRSGSTGGGEDFSSVDYWDDEALLERMDIVWPSRTYIHNANRPDETEKPLLPEQVENAPHEDSTEPVASFVFLSSNTFNSCDQSCVTRMTRFQISDPPQRLHSLVPHFKSIGRLVTKRSVIRKHGFTDCSSSSSATCGTARDYLSWFLLTSACLSQGAQGKRAQEDDAKNPCGSTRTKKEGKVQYANFELGVLFTSRIQPREKRLYCFAPHQCSCQSLVNQNQKLIHLPIPYSLHPKPFMEEDDDSIMQETPFFHEIEDGTRCVGNMLLTPFGIREAKKQKVRSKSKNDN